jgi:hypothetical protein
MPSHDKKLDLDLVLSNSPTYSVETSTLGVKPTFSTSLPSSSVRQVDKISKIPHENLV